jgi:membrane associated rhomboid family serine protease
MSENWMHLLWNTVFLFGLRKIIVMIIPDRLILVYYLGWGVLVGLANYLIACNFEYSYLIGSSGVIMAFMGYLVVFVGTMKVNLFYDYKISFFSFAIIILSTSIIQLALGTNVYGNIAHINGFIFGLITGKIYKKISIWQHN